MLGKSIRLFKLFGFEVKADLSWIVLAILVAWSLAVGLFPYRYAGLTPAAYWTMGVAGTIGLFLSIIAHEMCHSLAARKYGIPMRGITLFIFGGVAEMVEEPPGPRAEFAMAIVGPVSSVVLGLGLLWLHGLGLRLSWPVTVVGVAQYLGWINLLLAGFNLLPAFPLDGGRVLRSLLWQAKGDFHWATRIASGVGVGFGAALIVLGVFQFLAGSLIGGAWTFLIGMFLQSAARMAFRQLVIRESLEGRPVRRFMKPDPVGVPAAITLRELVEDYIYKYHYKLFPVIQDHDRLRGCISTKQVAAVPRESWASKTVGECAAACSRDNTVDPQRDAAKVLAQMGRTG
ncbi:MAG: site-2 protease family protein, partial [Elusimicrobia bacterium]|nr:site-2 protease family protein [Elusimicrobiota bacterium]